jgi:transcriptional regulator with XRE-family HTH domain
MGLRIERLRILREQKGLSQRELARLCGLSATQIYKYENNQSDPTSTSLTMMADQLDVSTDYLLGRTDDPRGHMGDGQVSDEERTMIEIFRREGWPGVIRLGGERLSR